MGRRSPQSMSLLPMLPLALVLLVSPGCADGDRRANAFEFSYSYLAAELRMPELCEKISPRAYLAAPFGGRDTQITYTRSECYYHLALKTGDASYCRKVVPKKGLILDGRGRAEEPCRKEVESGRGLDSGGGDPDLITRFMGFRDEDMAAPGMRGVDRVRLSVRLPEQPDARERASLLPDFSRDGPAVVQGVSDHRIGCDDPQDPRWFCLAARCLASPEDGFRQACLEVTDEIKRLDEASGAPMGPQFPHVEDLLRRYPRLRGEFTAAALAAPRLREEARQTREKAEREAKAETERRTAHLRTTFEQVDRNHDGSLTLEEFAATPHRHFSPSDPADLWESEFAPLDLDHDGVVTSAEVAAAGGRSDAVLRFDLDHDGRCDEDELRRVLARSDGENARSSFGFLDIDTNGRVSKAEFDDDEMVQEHYRRLQEAATRK